MTTRGAPDDIADDEPLFSIPGELESRIELDSLDAPELGFAIEEATGMSQPPDLDAGDLLTVDAVVALIGRTQTTTQPRITDRSTLQDGRTQGGRT